jgi:hypothetical protein
MSPSPYTRLPGSGRRGGFLTLAVATPRCSLWLGPDHLLSVDSQRYQEDYKRFYYRDIQAIIIRRTKRANLWSIFFAVLFQLFGSLTLALDPDGRIIAGVMALAMAVFYLINRRLGPSCLCHLQTAVHLQELPSLKRLRTARKALDRLRPLIEQAQGALSREELLAAAAVAPPLQSSPATGKSAGAFGGRGDRPLRHDSGAALVPLFSLLLVRAGWKCLQFFFNNPGITIVSLLLFLGIMFLTVWAMVRQANSDLPRSLRRLTIGTMGYLCLMAVLGYIQMIVTAINYHGANQWEMTRAFSAISARDSIWLSVEYAVSTVCALGLGVSGLILVRRVRERSGSSAALSETRPPQTQG